MLNNEIIERMELEQKLLSLYKENNCYLKEVFKMIILQNYCSCRIVQLRSNYDDAINQFVETMNECISELEDKCVKLDASVLADAKIEAVEELLKIENRTTVKSIFKEEVKMIENELY